MKSPYKQIHIKSWACMAEARAYYLMQGFKASEIWEDYDILRKGRQEVMISYQDFLKIKSSLIQVEELC
jgi:hypothetical protein